MDCGILFHLVFRLGIHLNQIMQQRMRLCVTEDLKHTNCYTDDIFKMWTIRLHVQYSMATCVACVLINGGEKKELLKNTSFSKD